MTDALRFPKAGCSSRGRTRTRDTSARTPTTSRLSRKSLSGVEMIPFDKLTEFFNQNLG